MVGVLPIKKLTEVSKPFFKVFPVCAGTVVLVVQGYNANCLYANYTNISGRLLGLNNDSAEAT